MQQGSPWRAAALIALVPVLPAVSGITAGSKPDLSKVVTEKYLPGAAE